MSVSAPVLVDLQLIWGEQEAVASPWCGFQPQPHCFWAAFPEQIFHLHGLPCPLILLLGSVLKHLPWWLRWWSICLQCRRPRFDPWVGKIPWRRKWQPTLVLLPGKFHEQRSLVGYSPQGCKESDMTEQLHFLSFFEDKNRFHEKKSGPAWNTASGCPGPDCDHHSSSWQLTSLEINLIWCKVALSTC